MIFQSVELLSAMRLSGMKNELLRQLELPAMDSLSFEERLDMIVAAEWNVKKDRKLSRLLKEANLKEKNARLQELRHVSL